MWVIWVGLSHGAGLELGVLIKVWLFAWHARGIAERTTGYGVVLTATWLLPFVLVPGTWEADEAQHTPPSVSS